MRALRWRSYGNVNLLFRACGSFDPCGGIFLSTLFGSLLSQVWVCSWNLECGRVYGGQQRWCEKAGSGSPGGADDGEQEAGPGTLPGVRVCTHCLGAWGIVHLQPTPPHPLEPGWHDPVTCVPSLSSCLQTWLWKGNSSCDSGGGVG